jgi:hypothetical protein
LFDDERLKAGHGHCPNAVCGAYLCLDGDWKLREPFCQPFRPTGGEANAVAVQPDVGGRYRRIRRATAIRLLLCVRVHRGLQS